ncbi:MAG: hypothetical protein BM556_07015 [Bacteriovorax sp. MedPE-SWde]|nr:MAG: hypothetical protein BM556_07015 [Bacteriovorax sp. MedPE-SWde]
MKNPILMVGFLFLAIFLFGLRDKGFFAKRANKLVPTSCKAVMVRLDKYLHKSWDVECDGNNLVINAPVDKKIVDPNLKDPKLLKPLMYKALANSYISISRYSPPDSLERTMIISVRLIHPHMTLNSISEGKHVSNLKGIKNFKNISKHIRETIQVQEVTKK